MQSKNHQIPNKYLTDDQKHDLIAQLRTEMLEAAENLDFERAAELPTLSPDESP